jgi:hypothetical protein
MLDDDSDGIRLGIERYEELFVFQLSHGGFGQAFVPAELAPGFLKVVGGNVVMHLRLPRKLGVKSDL